MTDNNQRDFDRLIEETFKMGPTRSFFAGDQNAIETQLGFVYNIDANVWNLTVTQGYLFHVKQCEQWVESVAANGVDPDSWAYQTQPWLREFGQQWCQGLVDYRNKLEKLFASVTAGHSVHDLSGSTL